MAKNDKDGQLSIYIDNKRIIVYWENLLRYKIIKKYSYSDTNLQKALNIIKGGIKNYVDFKEKIL